MLRTIMMTAYRLMLNILTVPMNNTQSGVRNGKEKTSRPVLFFSSSDFNTFLFMTGLLVTALNK